MTTSASREHIPTAISARRQPLLAVAVVTYNSSDVLPGMLDSLRDGLSGIESYRVFVVDNSSSDGCVDIATDHEIEPTVIQMGRNAGYAAAINAAAKEAGDEANLLVLNPDIRLLPGVAQLLCEAISDLDVGVAVPQILSENGEMSLSLRREPSMRSAWSDALLGTKLAARLGTGEIVDDPKIYSQGGAVEWATGAILAISARARRIVGEWDESFFLYSEEVDYFERIRRQGFKVVFKPKARAIHIGGAYHANPFLSHLMTRNRIKYFRRHHGRVATGLFRLSIIVGETLRAPLGTGHRAALRAALGLLR